MSIQPLVLVKQGPTTILGLNGIEAPEVHLSVVQESVSDLLSQTRNAQTLAFDLSRVKTLTDSFCEFVNYFATSNIVAVVLFHVDATIPAWQRANLNSRVRLTSQSIDASDARSYSHFDVSGTKQITVVSFRSKAVSDQMTINQIASDLQIAHKESSGADFVINLSNVNQLGSSALALLVRFDKEVKSGSGRLVICGLNPAVRDVVTTVGLHKLLNLQDTETDAVNFLS